MENDLKRPAIRKIALLMILAIGLGLIVTRIDTRPNWDDTGISMILLFFASAVCGFFVPRYPWLIAMSVSFWIPFYHIISEGNYGSMLAFVPGFAGAYSGFFLKKYISRLKPD